MSRQALEVGEVVLVAGRWSALADGTASVRVGDHLVVRVDARVRACQAAIARHSATWLILAGGIDDVQRDSLVQAARHASAEVHVAVLGGPGDRSHSERWLRRGCAAYLELTDPIDRVLRVLNFVRETGLIAVDKRFHVASGPDEVIAISDLTKREREVLHWLRQGRRNHEIAAALSVSGSTVGFHVRNVLEKLGARNRVEAIRRADLLGL